MNSPDDEAHSVLLMIADISGYTRYMTANAKTLNHSHTIINELLVTIAHQVESPLTVAKLEGDAMLVYGLRNEMGHFLGDSGKILALQWDRICRAFTEKQKQLMLVNVCQCGACRNLDRLRLKLFIHVGDAVFHRVGRFQELAGLDVILIHRLLKNTVERDEYLLLTRKAVEEISPPKAVRFEPFKESYDDIGTVDTRVIPISAIPTWHGHDDPGAAETDDALNTRLKRAVKWQWKIWLGYIDFRRLNQSTAEVGKVAQLAFASFMLLLSPLFIPLGLISALARIIRSGSGSR